MMAATRVENQLAGGLPVPEQRDQLEPLSERVIGGFGIPYPEPCPPESQSVLRANLALKPFLSEGEPEWSFLLSDAGEVLPKPGEGPHQSIETKEQRDEQDLSLPEDKSLSSQDCENEFCPVTEGTRRYRQAKNKRLCRGCFGKFRSGYFCDHCGQLYQPSSQNLDGKKWIGCDSCERWNHYDCAVEHGRKNFDSYHCRRCEVARGRQQKRCARPVQDRDFLYQEAIRKKRCGQRVRRLQELSGIPLFSKGRSKEENYEYLDSFLNAAGCKPHATDQALRRDMLRMALLAPLAQAETQARPVQNRKQPAAKPFK